MTEFRKLLRRRDRFGNVIRARANRSDLQLIERVIDRSRLAPRLEGALDDARTNGAGRPRVLPVRTLLVGLLALATAGQPLHLRRVYELLTNLHPATRRRLGVEAPDGQLVTERQVAYLFTRICEVHDISAPAIAELPDEEHHRRRQQLQRLLDDLLAATLPDHDRTDRPGRSYALDATTLACWARGWRNPARRKDPDAGWSVKSADGSTALDVEGGTRRPRGRRRDEFVFGYDVHAFTWTRDDDQPAGSVPSLTERIVVFGGGRSDMDRITEVFDELTTTRPLHDLIVDRWYSQHLPGRFALRARRAGADLVFDLKADQRGPDGTFKGALKIDGELYCPATPDGLHTLPDAYYKDTKARAVREDRAAKREPWRLRPHAAADADGYQRYRCPAEAGQLRCPLKPRSQALPAATTPSVLTPPATPGDCCTQRTITVPPSVNASTRQKHPWGSEAWRRSFSRRSSVEGPFGVLKTTGGVGMKRDHIRVVGITAFSLLTAFYVAASNLLHLARFEQRAEEAEHRDDDTSSRGTTSRRRDKTLDALIPAPPASGRPPPGG